MATKVNTLEGIADDAAVTPANSGGVSGDAFTTVTLGGTGTVIAQNDVIWRGSRAVAITKQVGFATIVIWAMTNSTSVTARFKARFSGLPSQGNDWIRFRNATLSGTRLSVGMNSTGTIYIGNAAGTVIWTSTGSLSINTWYEFEFAITTPTTSTGTCTLNVYEGDSDTPIANVSVALTAQNFSTGGIGNFVFGANTTSGTWATMYFDDLQVADSTTTLPTRLVDPPPTGGNEWWLATGAGWVAATFSAL